MLSYSTLAALLRGLILLMQGKELKLARDSSSAGGIGSLQLSSALLATARI